MTNWTIIDTASGAVIRPCVITDVGQTLDDIGCAPEIGQQAIQVPFEPDPARHKWTNGAWAEDPALGEAIAMRRLAADAEAVSLATVTHERDLAGINSLWHEIQRYKMFVIVGGLPTQAAQLRRQFPTLMALVTLQSPKTLAIVADEQETRLLAPVRKNALWQAKRILAQDAIAAAPTPAGKLAAANGVTWTE